MITVAIYIFSIIMLSLAFVYWKDDGFINRSIKVIFLISILGNCFLLLKYAGYIVKV